VANDYFCDYSCDLAINTVVVIKTINQAFEFEPSTWNFNSCLPNVCNAEQSEYL